ncbi:MCE family protein [Saccharopolyspora sp. HNM0983]|uniref:MCE family protein n=1 Tax=Saccharopolyspora montiporae TaxID=2781240 RepID=A0A929B9X0_9PSEU|nr:MCE family protein [Saccharopolyspora sp. HNM0983]MBE9374956.1 MCE family protein [Saccharopolyspora sp. HNM0983]
MSAKRVLRAVLAVGTAALVLAGCGTRGVYDMSLPGGADLGGDPYQVRVRFADVLDLVPNAGVRVNDVPVGRVQTIRLAPDSWQAEAVVQVNGDVRLPENASARLRQSSLLGEKFVELGDPPQPEQPAGRLADDDLIGIDRTNRNPEVEEVLGALSMLLNGGGVAQLQNITRELNNAMEGRESDIKGLLSNVEETVAGLDAQRDDITRALESIDRLSASLEQQRGSIETALDELEPGLRVLNEQRGQLVTMLESLDELSGVATDTVNRSREDLVHNLNQLAPTLEQLAAAGENLPKSLEILLTFPFPDNAAEGIGGSDYTNLYADVDLNLSNLLENLGRSRQPIINPPNPAEDSPLPLSGDGGDSGQQQQEAPEESDGSDSGGLLGGVLGGS